MNVFIQSPGYQGYFPNTNGGVITVEKYEELEAWAEMLLSKPSLLDVHCRRANTKNDNSEADQIIRDGYFAVIVNPNNPQIKGQIEKALDEARSAMKAGKKFVLTFDVRNAISDWFIQNVKADVRCQYGRLFVTNHYVYQDIEDKFCGTTVEKIVCCGCFLCACCLYTFHRLILCSNISVDVTGQVIQINLEPENTTVIGDSTVSDVNGKSSFLKHQASVKTTQVLSVPLHVPKPEDGDTIDGNASLTTDDSVNLVMDA
uniref:Uncharacterized protein LOC102808965 n=1 Tax=Saccoglossus kowalevskii TaxID=10224 RepID=A0ABM0MET9_SACKO|nr:PREDICTED: uncharacterized protein LOC102808965 [Saccoglossus kowalevskii]